MSFICDYWSDLAEEVLREFVFVNLRLARWWWTISRCAKDFCNHHLCPAYVCILHSRCARSIFWKSGEHYHSTDLLFN